MTIAIAAFIISFFFLARSGTTLVQSMTFLARLFKMSEYTIAFIFMSAGTSVAELFVGISSALENIPTLSLGNIMGANLINITLVVGVTALVAKGIVIDSKLSKQNFWLVAMLAFLPLLLASDGVISRGDGLVLLVFFTIYIWKVAGEREYFTKVLNNVVIEKTFVHNAFSSIFKFLTATAILILSSATLVWSGKILAQNFAFDLLSFGVIFVAIGTTLPELSFGIRAATLNHASMSIGNSLGSIAFNSAFIVGIVSLIHPITVLGEINLMLVSAALLIAFILFNMFVYTKNAISYKEAAILIGVYIVFTLSTLLTI